jgi:hypothetical protein
MSPAGGLLDAAVDLIWIVPYLTVAALAVTWRPPEAEENAQVQRLRRRASLLCFKLILATMVLGSAILGLRLVNSTRVIGLIAVSIVLFSFAVRSALMQDTQEKYLAYYRFSIGRNYRPISIDITALAAQSPATIGKIINVCPVESIARPMRGSPMPAKI